MRAKFGSIEVEGTAQEIEALIRAFGTEVRNDVSAGPLTTSASGRVYVSEEIAFRALKRRQLSPEQSIVLGRLAKNHPGWTTAFELHKATKYNPNQLAGLMGAFGKRVSATDGYVPESWFFEQEWDYEASCYKYRLPDGVLSAVKRAGL